MRDGTSKMFMSVFLSIKCVCVGEIVLALTRVQALWVASFLH